MRNAISQYGSRNATMLAHRLTEHFQQKVGDEANFLMLRISRGSKHAQLHLQLNPFQKVATMKIFSGTLFKGAEG
jgi:hypothetical protein